MQADRIKLVFEKNFGNKYRTFSAPGRINLIGEHTDYNDGYVLPASIDKRIYLAIEKVQDTSVHIIAADLNQSVSFEVDKQAEGLPHWARYPYGVIREMLKEGYQLGGFRAVFGGDIPEGAGLSSSAAIESVFGIAINQLFECGASLRSLAFIGQRAEHHYVGVNCGIMDQYASLFGKKDHAILLDCRSLKHKYFPLHLKDHLIVLADTHVKHNLASSAYNQRRAQCETGVNMISKKFPAVKSLRDVDRQMLFSMEHLIDQVVFKRCLYVIEENQRVLNTTVALSALAIDAAGTLMYDSHEGLSKLYEVSCPELDVLVEIAQLIPGVAGARMMGGGFGGCTINLVREDSLEFFKQTATTCFRNTFGTEPSFYSVTTSKRAS